MTFLRSTQEYALLYKKEREDARQEQKPNLRTRRLKTIKGDPTNSCTAYQIADYQWQP